MVEVVLHNVLKIGFPSSPVWTRKVSGIRKCLAPQRLNKEHDDHKVRRIWAKFIHGRPQINPKYSLVAR